MIDIIATLLILYLLYKLVFDFIVPVSRTTTQFKKHVNEMRKQQETMYNRQQQYQQQQQSMNTAQQKTTSGKADTTTTDGEYIDFEEVK
jgi:Sec-independent protein translocase protein TatA